MAEGDLYANFDEALAGAARLTAAGSSWPRVWDGHAAGIAAAEAADPFGDDEIGLRMRASYQATAEALRPAGKAFGECFESLGDQCRTAVEAFRAADHPPRTSR